MAQRVFQYACTIPAGTPQDTPVTIGIDIDNWNLETLDLEVPAGPAGLMGFYVVNNGQQWIPASPGEFIVWDDILQSWYFTDQPNAAGWGIVGYNTGYYDHTVTVRFHVNPPSAAQVAGTAPQIILATSDVTSSPVTTL